MSSPERGRHRNGAGRDFPVQLRGTACEGRWRAALQVREALTLLDLDVLIYPCPKGGTAFRPRVRQLSGKEQFPFLVDPNTGAERASARLRVPRPGWTSGRHYSM